MKEQILALIEEDIQQLRKELSELLDNGNGLDCNLGLLVLVIVFIIIGFND